ASVASHALKPPGKPASAASAWQRASAPLRPPMFIGAMSPDVTKMTLSGLNVAVICVSCTRVSVHRSPEPAHAPDQLARPDSRAAVAGSVMLVPGANCAEHVFPHEKPAGLDVTVPVAGAMLMPMMVSLTIVGAPPPPEPPPIVAEPPP